jgi:YVTN family beta-propeller protein
MMIRHRILFWTRSLLPVVFLHMSLPGIAKSAELPGSGETAETTTAVEASSVSGGRQVIREGIALEFTLEPVAGGKGRSTIPLEGEEAEVRFTITDAATGTAMAGLHPVVWMDLHEGDQATPTCKEKIRSFLQGSLAARPTVDLNTYHILTLNHEANISVIDPLSGFGTSKLLALVMLKGPGEDWVLGRDRKRLFVTIPKINQVAVVDTARWKVVASIDVGRNPRRVALQSDEKYLWVGDDAPRNGKAEGGVTVIDTATLAVVAWIQTGMGPHEIAFSANDRYAFITNRLGDTLSIVDVRSLKKITDLKTGRLPAALAFSSLSQRIYVAHEAEGTIVTVDVESRRIVARMKARSGLRALRFTPDGRWGFAVNAKDHVVHIFDASTDRILHVVEVGKDPDQVTFTNTLAYIRSLGTHEISTVPLSALGKDGPIPVLTFSGGQIPPGTSTHGATADAIVPAPEGNSVLVANPADQTIYYYMEGMAAPMGSFQNYRREPKAVLVVDRSLRETSPGLYTTTTRLPTSGTYDVAFLLDSPRISHCFDLTVKANPARQEKKKQSVHLEVLLKERRIRVGHTTPFQIRLTDPLTNQPKVGLKDVRVLAVLSPGVWQKREWARSVGDGIYEISLSVPRTGVYYLFFECLSLNLRFDQLPKVILHATDQEPVRSGGT